MARCGVAVPTVRPQGGVVRGSNDVEGGSMMTLLGVGLAILLLVFWGLLGKKA